VKCKIRNVFLVPLAAVGLLLVGLATLVWALTYHPPAVEPAAVVCAPDAPAVPPDRPLKVMTWNVQFMAGKGYVFFYDLPAGNGPDERPSPGAIAHTLDEVARVVRAEPPDVLLLQEVDDGAGRTDRQDELAGLLQRLPADYACHAQAWYWKAAYVPHPRIHGPVGMKLAVVSRYRIDRATRYSLPGSESRDLLGAQFNLKRALLEAWLPLAGGGELAVLDTHLAAFAQGSDTLERQVRFLAERLDALERGGHPWLIGGDFNLLPPGPAYREMTPAHQACYRPDTELALLYDRWPVLPDRAMTGAPDRARWFTEFPNDPVASGPDRTIDYLFHSPRLRLEEGHVRREDTLKISDHLPLVASLRPATGR
jgi:endonuclease/exonuclease/phosphatase family metal-dependent hydrolase